MAFNPITDLRLNSDDKIEDAPAVNIEVELLPLLRRTASKTKQVANVIKSNNSLLKSDLERITTLRRRLQRVIPVIPRMVGTAGAIFGQQIDREPPSGFPFLAPIIGGGRPPRPPVIEETKKETEIKKETELEMEIEKNLDISKDKTAVKERVRELIKSGALEEARKLAEQEGISSEFPELQTTNLSNKDNINRNQELVKTLEELMEKNKNKKPLVTSIVVNGQPVNYDLMEIAKEAEKYSFLGDPYDPLRAVKYEFVRTTDANGFPENKMVPMTAEPPSAYLILVSEFMKRKAAETGETLRVETESFYQITATPDGKIYINSPKYLYDLGESARTNIGLNVLAITQAFLDVAPTGIRRGQIYSRTNPTKVKFNSKLSYKNVVKQLNKQKYNETLRRFLKLDRKEFNKLIKDLDTKDITKDIDAQNYTIVKLILSGKYNPKLYSLAERQVIDAFIDSTLQMIDEGMIKNAAELDSFLKFLQSGSSRIPPQLQDLNINKLIKQLQALPQFAVPEDNKLSSLNIDTGDNTLIVLMGNDDSPIPSFG